MSNKSTINNNSISNHHFVEGTDSALAFMLKMANKRLKANLEEIQVIKSVRAKVAANKNSSS